MKTKTTKILKWCGGIVITISIIYSLLVWHSNSVLHQAYHALQNQNRPMNSNQVIPQNTVDIKNAALDYQMALLYIKSSRLEQEAFYSKKFIELSQRVSYENVDKSALLEFKKYYDAPVFAAFIKFIDGGKGKTFWPNLDINKGPNALLTHVHDHKELLQIVCTIASYQNQTNDSQNAWGNTIRCLRVANALNKEPLVISQIMRADFFDKTTKLIQSMSKTSLPTMKQSKTLNNLLKEFEEIKPYITALDGERLLIGEWLYQITPQNEEVRKLATYGGNDGFGYHLFSIYSYFYDRSPFLNYDHANYLKAMLKHYTSITNLYGTATKLEKPSSLSIMFTYNSKLLFHINPKFMYEMIAKAKMTRLGLAILQFKKSKGIYPDSIKDLNVPFITDPFTGSDFQYHKDSKGFLISSSNKKVENIQWSFPFNE
ncbi:MAG: hypothetical protein COA79_07900 [Planctomycetota bacterium]|nr:MAG: hypothetical protein COA79_07900 [Planctomycetota bacterium]